VLGSIVLSTSSWDSCRICVICAHVICSVPINLWKYDSLGLLNGSGDTVETLGHSFPVLGHLHHAPSIQHTVAKQVVELEAHAVPPPLVNLVMELVPLGGQDRQVLHVSPSEVRAGADQRSPGWTGQRQDDEDRIE